VVNEFFVRDQGLTFNQGLAVMTSFGMVSMIVMLIAPFYKALSDRYGRKLFLVINTVGMTVSLFTCLLAPSFPIYMVGTICGMFFIAHDMQVTYILEVAPSNKRATFYGVTKAIGTLGFVLVPLCRSIFMGTSEEGWRNVFLVPGLIGVVVVLLCIFLARESDIFLEHGSGIKY
jgi:MFS family permease